MSVKPRYLLWGVAWFLAVSAALRLGSLPGDLSRSMCGVWGCYPPLQALAAMHGFWALLLLPPVAWAISRWPGRRLWLTGALMVALGLAGISVVFAREALTWLPSVPPTARHYFPRRLLYAIVTLSDVPLVQVTLAGSICWAVAWWRDRSRAPVTDQSPSPGRQDSAC